MKNSLLFAMLLLCVVSVFKTDYALAAACKPKHITVSSNASGVFTSLATAQAIVRSGMNQLVRKWVSASTKAYGAEFAHISRGTCTCSFNNKRVGLGDRMKIRCQLSARPCDYPHVFMQDFKCDFK
jgi:hypothetical protein